MMSGFTHIEFCPFLDEMGNPQDIPQGEGGEQGDPLMPLLFAFGLHRALTAVQERLVPGEKVFALLDDVYVICARYRVFEVHQLLQEELQNHTQISASGTSSPELLGD